MARRGELRAEKSQNADGGGHRREEPILLLLPSLRRYDPDQVRRVGDHLSRALSAPRTPGNRHAKGTTDNSRQRWRTVRVIVVISPPSVARVDCGKFRGRASATLRMMTEPG